MRVSFLKHVLSCMQCPLIVAWSLYAIVFLFISVFNLFPFFLSGLISILLLLPAVISISLYVLVYFSRPRIFESSQSSMLVSPLSPSFLDTYYLSLRLDVRICEESSISLSWDLLIWVPSLSILRLDLSILQRRLSWLLFFGWGFCCRSWF